MKFREFHPFSAQNIMWLAAQYGAPTTVVEIGVFQGATTFNMVKQFAKNNSQYKHYAIDPFRKYDDMPHADTLEAEPIFRANLDECELSNHIEFIHETSWNGLMELHQRGVKADFIYVDGDHSSEGALDDIVLSFAMLKKGGILLCDDATDWRYQEHPARPTCRFSVDSFVHCNWNRLHVLRLPNNTQQGLQKA